MECCHIFFFITGAEYTHIDIVVHVSIQEVRLKGGQACQSVDGKFLDKPNQRAFILESFPSDGGRSRIVAKFDARFCFLKKRSNSQNHHSEPEEENCLKPCYSPKIDSKKSPASSSYFFGSYMYTFKGKDANLK